VPRTLKFKLYLIDYSRLVFLYNNKLHQAYPCVIFFTYFNFLSFLKITTHTSVNWMNQGLKKFGLWFISNKSFWTLHWRFRRSLVKRVFQGFSVPFRHEASQRVQLNVGFPSKRWAEGRITLFPFFQQSWGSRVRTLVNPGPIAGDPSLHGRWGER